MARDRRRREGEPVRAAKPRPVPPAEQVRPVVRVEPVPPGRPKLTLKVE
jgi:hypothetical protein